MLFKLQCITTKPKVAGSSPTGCIFFETGDERPEFDKRLAGDLLLNRFC
jgi:hypothetical protein